MKSRQLQRRSGGFGPGSEEYFGVELPEPGDRSVGHLPGQVGRLAGRRLGTGGRSAVRLQGESVVGRCPGGRVGGGVGGAAGEGPRNWRPMGNKHMQHANYTAVCNPERYNMSFIIQLDDT